MAFKETWCTLVFKLDLLLRLNCSWNHQDKFFQCHFHSWSIPRGTLIFYLKCKCTNNCLKLTIFTQRTIARLEDPSLRLPGFTVTWVIRPSFVTLKLHWKTVSDFRKISNPQNRFIPCLSHSRALSYHLWSPHNLDGYGQISFLSSLFLILAFMVSGKLSNFIIQQFFIPSGTVRESLPLI